MPISSRRIGELCRLLEKRGKGDQQFQLLIENIDELILFLGQLEAGIKKPAKFQKDMTEEGWTLIEDVSDPGLISVEALELITFLKEGEEWISGKAMRDRAKELGAMLGQRQAEFLLDHQAEIPKGWREYYFVFFGTVWRVSSGFLYVPCLYWDGERWYLGFNWLGHDWVSGGRFVRLRK